MVCAYYLALAAQVALPHPQDNLAFERGNLTHWQGTGFHLTPDGEGPTLRWGVCSSDAFSSGEPKSAVLHRTLMVPLDAGAIRFRAAYLAPKNTESIDKIDVTLEAAGRTMIARRRRVGTKWVESKQLHRLHKGRPAEYEWPVANHAGKLVRIALLDRDTRPGCSLFCSGFEFVSQSAYQNDRFRREMNELVARHRLPNAEVRQTQHFYALSTATKELTREQLTLCETIYPLFYAHFRKRGFALREPHAKLMVAVFDSQAGVEAYVGQQISPSITGFYHRKSNRLVVYDYAQNRAYLDNRRRGQEYLSTIPSTMRKQQVVSAFQQHLRDRRVDTNIATLMHEVAHQISFNSGMLDRNGDIPLWLAEGLACYCESTEQGGWQGIGAPNRYRAKVLANPADGNGKFLPLRVMLEDDWLHKTKNLGVALLGYGQSWALFHMLATERPRSLLRYLEAIRSRRTSDHRLTDFAEAFGPDLDAFERDYVAYMKHLVKTQVR